MSSNHLSSEVLEQRAAEQRRRLAESVTELKSTVREEVHERLDAERYARQYLWPAIGVSSVLALVVGYSFAGMFSRR